jgi:hypothetical protein
MIFKVWQSVNESCKDPTRDTVLGFAAVDLTVLLFGMPWVSGWFSIMDFAGQCSGQIKVSIHALAQQLANLSVLHFTYHNPCLWPAWHLENNYTCYGLIFPVTPSIQSQNFSFFSHTGL